MYNHNNDEKNKNEYQTNIIKEQEMITTHYHIHKRQNKKTPMTSLRPNSDHLQPK